AVVSVPPPLLPPLTMWYLVIFRYSVIQDQWSCCAALFLFELVVQKALSIWFCPSWGDRAASRNCGCGRSSQLPQLKALDLARRRHWQFVNKLQPARVFIRRNAVLHEVLQLCRQV